MHEGKGFRVETCRAEHRLEAWSYTIAEKPRPGKFYPGKARDLGVPEGVLWKRLQDGEEIMLGDKIVRSSRFLTHLARGDASSTLGTRGQAIT